MRQALSSGRSPLRPSRPFGWVVVALFVLVLGGAAAAQDGQDAPVVTEVVNGTQIILPDGTRCLPLPAGERQSVAGAELEHYCGDGAPKGLVGGILESAGQVSLEVVDLSGQQDATSHAAGVSQLALFRVQRLVLENGAVCLPAESSSVVGDDRPVSYECDKDGQRSVVLGSLETRTVDGQAAGYVTVADLGSDGAVIGGAEQVTVAVIDGTLPFTRSEWVLSSWGTGQAPPIAGAAPTLAFGEGMVNGRTGCNSYFAPASILAEGQLVLGVAGSTLMACSEELMSQEFRFMAALDGVTGYELIDDDLYLFGGAEVLRFERAAQ